MLQMVILDSSGLCVAPLVGVNVAQTMDRSTVFDWLVNLQDFMPIRKYLTSLLIKFQCESMAPDFTIIITIIMYLVTVFIFVYNFKKQMQKKKLLDERLVKTWVGNCRVCQFRFETTCK